MSRELETAETVHREDTDDSDPAGELIRGIEAAQSYSDSDESAFAVSIILKIEVEKFYQTLSNASDEQDTEFGEIEPFVNKFLQPLKHELNRMSTTSQSIGEEDAQYIINAAKRVVNEFDTTVLM